MWSEHLQKIYFKYFETSSGVELFFVIAGYFAAKKLSKADTLSGIGVAKYIVSRFKRLSPLMYFWGLVMFLWGGVEDPQKWGSHLDLYNRLIGTITYTRNFQTFFHSDAFSYFWAVSLELQFFVCFAMLMYVFNKNRNILWHVLGLVVIIFSFYRPGIFSSPWFRIDSLILGLLLYTICCKIHDNDEFCKLIGIGDLNKFEQFSIFFGLLISLASSVVILGEFNYLKYSLTAIIAFVLTFLAILDSPIISFKSHYIDLIFEKIGDYSFSLYVSHIITWWIGMDLLNLWIPNRSIICNFLLSLTFMIITTILSHKYIENILK